MHERCGKGPPVLSKFKDLMTACSEIGVIPDEQDHHEEVAAQSHQNALWAGFAGK